MWQKQTLLTKDDCNSLISLMDNGFSLQDSMDLIDCNNTNMAFIKIKKRLMKGEQLSNFFAQYLPKTISAYFGGFIKWMPFIESLKLTMQIIDCENKSKKEIIKGMLYPCILLIGVLVGILVFNTTILPQMITMMNGFGLENNNYKEIAQIITICTKIFMIISLTCVLIIGIALSNKYIVKTYQLLSRILPDSILCGNASTDFARFFLQCTKMKISTRESLKILKSIPGKPLVKFIAQQLDNSLTQGDRMDKAITNPYVEQALSRFFRIAIYASNCEKMLEGYLKMVETRTEIRIRRFTKIVQLFAYSTIGIILVFIYQILMMPMSMIQSI